MHLNIDDLSRPCFIVFRTKNDDEALIFIIFESMCFRVHFDGGSILTKILTSFSHHTGFFSYYPKYLSFCVVVRVNVLLTGKNL